MKLKNSTTITVILPALNEEPTVGTIVKSIRHLLVDANPIVDELVVLDSGSTDGTAQVAADAGATVIHRADVFPHLTPYRGKGEAMWRGLAATTGDIVVYVDADLQKFDPHYITSLVEPLLSDPTLQFVKAAYYRPLHHVQHHRQQHVPECPPGGRITELVARPLLNVHFPLLAGFSQPLTGELAARRSLLEKLPFPVGYGVDIALLIDTLHSVGLDAMAQVDLRDHSNWHQPDSQLGLMASEIIHSVTNRLCRLRGMGLDYQPNPTFTHLLYQSYQYSPYTQDLSVHERPPVITVR